MLTYVLLYTITSYNLLARIRTCLPTHYLLYFLFIFRQNVQHLRSSLQTELLFLLLKALVSFVLLLLLFLQFYVAVSCSILTQLTSNVRILQS